MARMKSSADSADAPTHPQREAAARSAASPRHEKPLFGIAATTIAGTNGPRFCLTHHPNSMAG